MTKEQVLQHPRPSLSSRGPILPPPAMLAALIKTKPDPGQGALSASPLLAGDFMEYEDIQAEGPEELGEGALGECWWGSGKHTPLGTSPTASVLQRGGGPAAVPRPFWGVSLVPARQEGVVAWCCCW